MRSFHLLSFALLVASSPAPDLHVRQVNQCSAAACYQNLQYADSNDLANAQKDCKSYQGSIVTPCPTILTRTVAGTITVTSTKTVGQKSTTPIPSSAYTTSSSTASLTTTSACIAQTLTNYVPPYATVCNANDFGLACSCLGVQQTTSTLKWKTLTQMVTTYSKTKTLTVTITPSSTPKTTTTTKISTTSSTSPVTTPTTTPTTSTSAGCLATPIINGDFSSGQISPWTLPNGGPGVVTSSFAPPGKQYSFAVELSSTANTTGSLLFQQINACQGAVYTCSFQHAYQLSSGTLEYFGLNLDIDAVNPVFGWMTTWPNAGQWYTETFNFTAGQDGYNGNDVFMPQYYTPEPTASYDFIGYFADFQCSLSTTSATTTTSSITVVSSTMTSSTTSTAPTPSTSCPTNPLTNGDFNTGQLAPWSDPYNGRVNQNAGGIMTAFTPPGETYAWAANLNSQQPEYSGQIQQYLNTCAGKTYTCSYSHAWIMNSGQSSYFQFMMQINSAQPQIGYINALWPNAGQWYTETFNFTAQGGGSDYIFTQYYTWEGTAASYDFTGYFGGLQCSLVSPSTSTTISIPTSTTTPVATTTSPTTTTTSTVSTTSTTTPTSANCLASPVINGNFASGSISPWIDQKYDGFGDLDTSNPPGQQVYDWAPAISSRCTNCSSASLSQTLNTCTGSTYVCTFQFAWESSNGYGLASEVGVQISRNSDILLASSMTKYPNQYTYYQDSVTFVAKGNDQVTWKFLELTPTSSYYYWVGFLGNFQCSMQTSGIPTTTTSASQPTSTACSTSTPVVNGDFSSGPTCTMDVPKYWSWRRDQLLWSPQQIILLGRRIQLDKQHHTSIYQINHEHMC